MAIPESFRVTHDNTALTHRFHRLSPRMRLALGIVGGLILLLILWHFLAPLFAPHKKAPPAPPVKTAIAVRRDVTVNRQTIGTVVSPVTVQITAQVTGKLIAAHFREGQIVHKGQLLFEIDPASYRAAAAEAAGSLARDAAQLADARLNLQRYQALAAQNAIAKQQLTSQQATVKADEGVVASDQANLDAARINLAYTRIVSPIDGKTGAMLIQPGNVITADGQNALLTITQVQPVKLSFMMPQNLLAQIQNQYAAGQLTASVTVAGVTERAPVDFIGNIVDASTGTIELRADFPNTDMRLVPGQTVPVSVALRHIAGAVVVPRDAVNAGPSSSFVYVVGQDGRALSRTVKLLYDDGTNDAISGDVNPGDRVITEGQLRVVPGQAVRIGGGGKP